MKKLLARLAGYCNSFQMKIFIALSSVAFLTLAVVILSWYSYDRNTLREAATKNAINMITSSNSNLEILLKDIEHCNNIISLNDIDVVDVLHDSYAAPSYDWFKDYQKTESFLNAMLAYRTNTISGIGIFAVNGDSYIVGNVNTVEDIYHQTWYRNILKAQGENILISRSADSADENSGEVVLSMGKAIMDNGQCLGIVLTDIKYDIVTQAFRENDGIINTLLVIDSSRDIIYQSSKDHIRYRKDAADFRTILSMIGTHRQNMPYRISGRNYRLIPYHSSYTGWDSVAIVSQDLLENEIRHIQRIAFLFFAILLMATILISVGVSNGITRNLKILNANIRRVSAGDFTQIQPVTSNDEIGWLAAAFQEMVGRINGMMTDIQHKEREIGLMEIKALQAQVSPHFLYNSLNTINYLARMQKADNISEITTSLIDLLRLTIGYEGTFIPIREEVAHVQNYITIQKYKYFHEFRVEYQVDPELLDYRTPHMILQPIVENALIHEIEPMSNQDGRIQIRIVPGENRVLMSVTDNGVGMDPELIARILTSSENTEKLRFSRIGISNVNKRIQLYFGRDYGVRIYSQPGLYTTVEIQIPVMKEARDINDPSPSC